MRNILALFLLFIGALMVSCSQEGSSDERTDEAIEIKDVSEDSDETEIAQPEENELLSGSDAMTWKSYHNERFDFCVGYPSNFLKPVGESENQDGNTFENINGSCEMRASGILNALDETIEEAFERATEDENYYEVERRITYKRQKDNWFVISGKYYESIFYVRTVLVDDTFYTLYFEYHISEEDNFKEIIKVTTRDFPEC